MLGRGRQCMPGRPWGRGAVFPRLGGAAGLLGLALLASLLGPSYGEIHWATSFGSSSFDGAYGVSIDYLGSSFSTGKFAGIVPIAPGMVLKSHGEYDVFLVKTNTLGSSLWAMSMGGEGSDWARDVATDKAGNAYVAGSFSSSTATFDDSLMAYGSQLQNAGEFDIFLAKVNTRGSVMWAMRAGGTGFDYAQDVATDSMGNVYITGSFTSPRATFGSVTLEAQGATETYVVQVDAHANVKWGVRWGGSHGNALGYSLSTDAAGSCYVAGAFEGSVQIAPNLSLHSAGSWDIFVVKMATSLPVPGGVGIQTAGIIWAQSMGGSLNDAPKALDTDRDGNLIVVGSFSSIAAQFGSTILHVTGKDNGFRRTQTYTGHPDLFVAKINHLGSVDWAKGMGGAAEENAYGVATDNMGGILVTGEYGSEDSMFGPFRLRSSGTRDIFLLKMATDGKVVAAVSAGGYLEDIGRDVAVDHVTGNYLVAGHFSSPSATFGSVTLTTRGGSDAFLLSLEDTHEAAEGGWKSVLWNLPKAKGVSFGGGEEWRWMELAFLITVVSMATNFMWGSFRKRYPGKAGGEGAGGHLAALDDVKAAVTGERRVGSIQSVIRRAAGLHVYPVMARSPATATSAEGGGEEASGDTLKRWSEAEGVGYIAKLWRRTLGVITGENRVRAMKINQVPFAGAEEEEGVKGVVGNVIEHVGGRSKSGQRRSRRHSASPRGFSNELPGPPRAHSRHGSPDSNSASGPTSESDRSDNDFTGEVGRRKRGGPVRMERAMTVVVGDGGEGTEQSVDMGPATAPAASGGNVGGFGRGVKND